MKFLKLIAKVLANFQVAESVLYALLFAGFLIGGFTYLITRDKTVVAIVLIFIAVIILIAILRAYTVGNKRSE
jgi:hypothetical protein